MMVAVKNREIKEIGPQNNIERIQCLQYADDAIIFYEAKRDYMCNLKFILYSFELISCLKKNFEKILWSRGIGLKQEEIE